MVTVPLGFHRTRLNHICVVGTKKGNSTRQYTPEQSAFSSHPRIPIKRAERGERCWMLTFNSVSKLHLIAREFKCNWGNGHGFALLNASEYVFLQVLLDWNSSRIPI